MTNYEQTLTNLLAPDNPLVQKEMETEISSRNINATTTISVTLKILK